MLYVLLQISLNDQLAVLGTVRILSQHETLSGAQQEMHRCFLQSFSNQENKIRLTQHFDARKMPDWSSYEACKIDTTDDLGWFKQWNDATNSFYTIQRQKILCAVAPFEMTLPYTVTQHVVQLAPCLAESYITDGTRRYEDERYEIHTLEDQMNFEREFQPL
jgi:hypothetical protein